MVQLALHLADGFPILSLTLITEPLRVANRELGRQRFEWRAVSDRGGICQSSSGIPLDTAALNGEVPDAAILLSSYKPERSSTAEALFWLRRLDRKGCLLGCVDTGALVFARAGLLGVRPAAAHPEAIAGFHRQFPDSLFVDRMFDFSPPRFSSAGGVATLDMTLALIAHFSSRRLAQRVAQILTYDPPVAGWVPQAIPQSVPQEVRDAVAIMQSNLSRGMRISQMAGALGVPVWKFNRLFNRYLHCSPTTYFMQLRLAKARDMLRNTILAVGDIAAECGYDNMEAFSRAYRLQYGRPPSQDREL
ncbi:helix-turn-helix domain-containing protein [Leisingera daeponensis]|uniref:Helix-turn-helix domain-containing protein n=1 Tax=Leisingera daeponensis TaxID=405746 RepID=A0ABS7NL70_9RHOB|nr:helix-turn-helix domain-containing protein [Leisingera daeponensis]MBY6141917.1 helix-turn-helix domain-containing protein [Leisingera daeponensis]